MSGNKFGDLFNNLLPDSRLVVVIKKTIVPARTTTTTCLVHHSSRLSYRLASPGKEFNLQDQEAKRDRERDRVEADIE